MLQWSYPSEMTKFNDPLTGRPVTRLTDCPGHDSVHLYFTENAFTKGGSGVFFTSDRDTPGIDNVFTADRYTGDIRRVTGYTDAGVSSVTKDPESTLLLYNHGRDATLHDLASGQTQVLYTVPDGYKPGRLSLNCDKSMAGILLNEDVGVEHGVNYAGFEEKMYRVKRSRIMLVPLKDGMPGQAYTAFRDTCEAGHLQFSPTAPNILMYCHEGPWHLVRQRIFFADTDTLEVWPCFRQEKGDCVGHEFWTRDGLVFFDNRGPNHDGTITSARTQAVVRDTPAEGSKPWVGLADVSGNVVSRTPLPYYCNHYHCGSDPRILAGDAVDDIVRITLDGTNARMAVLCRHGTSWRGQKSHCHPTVSWDDTAVLFASDISGRVQLYLTDWIGR